MIINREQNGLFFQLEEVDWKGNWRELLNWVKSFQFKEQWEFDKMDNRWWICEELVDDFCEMKKKFIDEVLNPGQFNLEF